MGEHSIVLLMTTLNFMGAMICFAGALSPRMRTFPKWHTIGLLACLIGLLAQVGINLEFLLAEGPSPYAHIGLQPFKDLGIDIIAFTYGGRGILMWLDSRKQPELPVKPVRKAPSKPTPVKRNVKKVE